MTNKKTNKEFFGEVVAIGKAQGNAELVAWAEEKIKALENKAANRKPTKTQKENEGVKDEIVATLRNAKEPFTVTQILAKGNFPEGTSNQKVTALLRQLIEAGEVVKTTDKKKSFFTAKGE